MLSNLSDERTILWVSTLFYCSGFAYIFICIARKRLHLSIFRLLLIGTGFILQTFALYLRGHEVKSCPLGNPFEVLQFLVWSAILLYFLVGPVFRISLLGFFCAGLAAVISMISLLVPAWDSSYELAQPASGPWIETHAATAMFSYGVFCILALTSAMFILQNFGLKEKRINIFSSLLPSIVQLDQINIRLLLTGVIVMSFSLFVGAYYWVGNGELVRLPKLLTTSSIWVAYLIILCLHRTNRLLPLKFAWYCILLFAIALISIWPVASNRTENGREIPFATSGE
ncbi:MAG: hypothetical protein DF168_01592 [Candidatus Moanabacter tarae]|uniref:Cytochrome c assembly protein domain-containing protein n=1 Tax=Candidatus Moanibacter tarae TaxID=2200854 RepID=A0A2Z4ADN9_9BACT|nr:MAG: hypothetical protein DF168_01592 [Candidatus Moanabacter tarae]|tara:strand:- start:1745 stop:2599 length:855 start_codon:yes stop_codon:yes gene_type:complete